MAQTLKFGNKTWATKEGSTLAYNDENGNYKPLPFAFTRSTSATRVNKEGLIEVVTNDRPRIDYTDTSDGVLLLEKAATNLITYSEDFSNSYWTKDGTSVTSGFVSPDGTNNAFKLVQSSANSRHFIKRRIDTSSSFLSNSIFVKAGEITKIGISESGSTDDYASFNLSNGVIIASGGNPSFSIKKMSNDWYRISLKSDSQLSRNDFNLALLSDDYVSGVPYSQSYQGDGTSGIYIWGAQVEAGNLSSYIPTQGSATTRVAETASGSGNSEVFNDSEGVLFANIAALATAPTRGITLGDGTSLNRIQFYYSSSNVLNGNLITNGSGQVTGFSYNGDANLFNKCALKYKVNDFAFWVNGFEVATDTSGITPTGLNELNFDNGTGTSDFYGKTKEIGYYNTILTDLELETLTSYKSWTSMVNELNLNIIYNG